ncbi:hypothetical protein [Limosilactobacillus sp.]|uniref:hypothetical protein n=1 Tax=Limosilactobacillus sp. TaxID=2773925 RepID=UPI0025C044B8|nr:hypothetical protein [Limosilactobacillus sp.]MCH3921896.1 hypothetical protein [Limosilactobacillus sp.]MCH3928667.1 hypothetical protein [Limosilactobacillus sp.]
MSTIDWQKDSKQLQTAVKLAAQGKTSLARQQLAKLLAGGSMKAGRYLAVLDLEIAAKRGDITAKIALANLYELGSIVDRDLSRAVALYCSALEDNHRDTAGFMLAAGADLGLGRIAFFNHDFTHARVHFERAAATGRPEIKDMATAYLTLMRKGNDEK